MQSHADDRLFELIAGALTPEEASGIRRHLLECPRCAARYEQEAVLESALFNVTEGRPSGTEPWAHGLEESFHRAGLPESLQSAAPFDEAFDRALAKALASLPSRRRRSAAGTWALAAGLALAAGAALWFRGKAPADAPRTAPAGAVSAAAPREEAGRFIPVDPGSAIHVASSADFRVEASGEGRFRAVLNGGSALFRVAKGRFKEFTVATPRGEIRVTGTRFRVSVTGRELSVWLAEGGVDYLGPLGPVHLSEGGRLRAGDSLRLEKMTVHEASALSRALFVLDSVFPLPESPAFRPPVRPPGSPAPAGPAALSATAALLAQGDGWKEKNDFLKALESYRAAAAADSVSPAGQTAIYEINLLYLGHLSDKQKGAAGFEAYLHRFPRGDWAQESMEHLIGLYMAEGRGKKAVALLDRYLAQFPGHTAAPDFWYQKATLLRSSLGDFPRAAGAYRAFLETFPGDYRAPDARHWLNVCEVEIRKSAP